MSFVDYFGGHAEAYRRFRPHYPAALFSRLAEQAPHHDLAWDVGTGSGQAAWQLAPHFARVLATDASPSQVACIDRRRATGVGIVQPVMALAEAPPLAAGRVALVTVAQALHWFDLPSFFAAVRRVASPGCCLAAWCYTLPTTAQALDTLIVRFHDEVVGPYWPARRRHVMAGYRDLSFPFAPIDFPSLAVEADWTLPMLRGYLGTWSAARRYRSARGTEPLAEIDDALRAAWGAANRRRHIRWPVHILCGTVTTQAG